MATALRRPKLSLQISPPTSSTTCTSSIFGPSTRQSMEPISAVCGGSSLRPYICERASSKSSSPRRSAPLLPISTVGGRTGRSSLRFLSKTSSDSEASEEENKFWSGEDNSSETSSEDESSDSEQKIMPVISKPLESPFLPPAPSMMQPKKKIQLRLITTITPATPTETLSPIVAPSSTTKRAKLSLTIPSSSPVSAITPFPASSRKSCLSSGSGKKKTVSFSPLADSIIENTIYTLSNADLLSYLSSGDCSEEELHERWGMTVHDAKMLGSGDASRRLTSKERRERKWIGLTNDFLSRKRIFEDNEDEQDR